MSEIGIPDGLNIREKTIKPGKSIVERGMDRLPSAQENITPLNNRLPGSDQNQYSLTEQKALSAIRQSLHKESTEKPRDSNKILVSSGGGAKREMTPAEADAEAYGSLAAAQRRIAHIPEARAWMEESGSTREVKIYVPDKYLHLYNKSKG